MKEGVDKLVTEAQADRAKARDDAAALRKSSTEQANAKIQQANDDFAERELEVVSAESELTQDQEALTKDREAFDGVITRTNRDLAEAKATQAKYLNAVGQLREAMGRIAGAL